MLKPGKNSLILEDLNLSDSIFATLCTILLVCILIIIKLKLINLRNLLDKLNLICKVLSDHYNMSSNMTHLTQ